MKRLIHVVTAAIATICASEAGAATTATAAFTAITPSVVSIEAVTTDHSFDKTAVKDQKLVGFSVQSDTASLPGTLIVYPSAANVDEAGALFFVNTEGNRSIAASEHSSSTREWPRVTNEAALGYSAHGVYTNAQILSANTQSPELVFTTDATQVAAGRHSITMEVKRLGN